MRKQRWSKGAENRCALRERARDRGFESIHGHTRAVVRVARDVNRDSPPVTCGVTVCPGPDSLYHTQTVVTVGTDMRYGGATHFYAARGAKDPLRMGAQARLKRTPAQANPHPHS
jgi:hypothetical protein